MAGTSAHAHSSVTPYGLIDAGPVYTDNQAGRKNWQFASKSTQNTVFGFKGSEDLGGGVILKAAESVAFRPIEHLLHNLFVVGV